MGGYWIHSPDNPFNQMDYTRGGGGRDNDQTRESNERRASAMQGAGPGAWARFADMGVAAKHMKDGDYAIVGDRVVKRDESRPTRKSGDQGDSPSQSGGSGRVPNTGTPKPGLAGAPTRLPVHTRVGLPSRHDPFKELDDDHPFMPMNTQLERVGDGSYQESLGAISDLGWIKTTTGYRVAPSKDAKERIEDDIFQQGMWNAVNVVLPGVGILPQPFPQQFAGMEDAMRFDFWRSEWQFKSRPGLNGSMVTGGGF